MVNTAATQPLFPFTGTGALTLPVGVYNFDCLIAMRGMSTTSGNLLFDLKGSGTATLAAILYEADGVDGPVATAAALSGSYSIVSASVASIVTAGTNANCQVRIAGTFEVTAGGTIIPSIALATASAAVIRAGSNFRCWRVGANGKTSYGPWS